MTEAIPMFLGHAAYHPHTVGAVILGRIPVTKPKRVVKRKRRRKKSL